MHLVIVDNKPELRAALLGRVREATRQSGIKRIVPFELDRYRLDQFDWSLAVGVIIGPGCQSEIHQLISEIRELYPNGKISAVLKSELYRIIGTELRIELGVYTALEGDLTQIVSFVIECNRKDGEATLVSKNRGIVGVVHLKGGVGCSSIALGMASCYAKHNLQVALVDFDDVTPYVSEWSNSMPDQRQSVSDFLRIGEVPNGRVTEILSPVSDYRGNLVVVPQPQKYGDSYHFKANSIPGAPCIRTYIETLLAELKAEFDVVVIDLGNSWGISTFVSLALCSKVCLVTDDNYSSVRQSLISVERIIRESNNDRLLGLKNWNFILNSYTNKSITPNRFRSEVEKLDLFFPSTSFFPVSLSNRLPTDSNINFTLYECEKKIRVQIQNIAQNMAPFITPKKKGWFF